MKTKNDKNLAAFTEEEDNFWVNVFNTCIEEHIDELTADEIAWRDTAERFPRLKEYDGAKT